MQNHELLTYSTKDKPIIFAFHGYPTLIHELTYERHNHNMSVHGYQEEGTLQLHSICVYRTRLTVSRVLTWSRRWTTNSSSTNSTSLSTVKTSKRSATGSGINKICWSFHDLEIFHNKNKEAFLQSERRAGTPSFLHFLSEMLKFIMFYFNKK